MIFPWHALQWNRLLAAARAGRLPHALLLTGARGSGKGAFAEALAAALLCERAGEDGAPCGTCRGCRLRAAGSHPDLVRVAPEEPGRPIKVEPVRAVIAFVGLTRQRAAHKIVIIDPAEAMNPSAANALLKTLEEPPPGSVFVLVSHQPGRLPATVRSRCRRIDLGATDPVIATEWLIAELGCGAQEAGTLLALAGGAPLAARALGAEGALERHRQLAADLCRMLDGRLSPVALAAGGAEEAPATLAVLQAIARDCIVTRLAGATPVAERPETAHLQALAKALDLRALFRFHDRIGEFARLLQTAPGLRGQALLEEILIELEEAQEGRA